MTDPSFHFNRDRFHDVRGMAWLHPALRDMSVELTGFGPLVEMMLSDSWAKVRVFRAQVSEMADLVGLVPDIAAQVRIEKQRVAGRSGQPDVPVIITIPKNVVANSLPAIYYLHGGGLCLGSAETELLVQARWAAELGCVLIAPNFRLIPEHPYPAAIDDMHTVFDWMTAHASDLHIDLHRVVVAGYSSGALLAAALTHRLKAAGKNQFCAQLLQFPQLDDRLDYFSSSIEFENVWLPSSERMMWQNWLAGFNEKDDIPPDAVPARAQDFSGIPPAIIHTAEHDHDRDACMEYARALLNAGVYVDLHLWGGAYHSFDQFQPESALSRRYMKMVDMQLLDALSGQLLR